MKRLLFPALILMASAAWAETNDKTPRERIDAFRVAQSYDCRNVSCKRLRSCDEACYKLIQCGQKIRDGDNDGIPCENLCRRRCR